jgi:hypothetical protein
MWAKSAHVSASTVGIVHKGRLLDGAMALAFAACLSPGAPHWL